MEFSLWLIAVSICFSNIFLTSGLVYGFPGLQTLLRSEGIYHSLCTDEEWANNNGTCEAEKAKYDLIFNLAANGATIATAQFGITLERFGPRGNALFGHFLLTLGFFLLAFSNDTNFDAFLPAIIFIGWGGIANFLVSFQFAFLFPSPVLIRTLMTALYTASGILFTIVDFIYDGHSNTLSRKPIFVFWGIIAACYLFVILALYPDRSYSPGEKVRFPISNWCGRKGDKYSPLDNFLGGESENNNENNSENINNSNNNSNNNNNNNNNKQNLSDNLLNSHDSETLNDHNHSVDIHSASINSPLDNGEGLHPNASSPDQLASSSLLVTPSLRYSPPHWDSYKSTRTFKEEIMDFGTPSITLFFTIGLLFMNLYLGNINQILKDKGDADGTYGKIFQFMFSFFPIVFSPFYTKIYHRVRYSGIVGLDVIAMILCWLPLFLSSLPAQIISFIIYSFARCFLVTVFFGYLATQYRQDHYGYLTAIATLVTGVIDVPAQLGMQDAIDAAGSGGIKYLYIAFMVGVVPFFGFVMWLRRRKW